MLGFKLQEHIIYRGKEGVVTGKRYGARLDPWARRRYDVALMVSTYIERINDIREEELRRWEEPVFIDVPFIPRLVKE